MLALIGSLAPIGLRAQKIRSYNLWVCPHCEGGVKSAEVADLRCEHDAADLRGANWPHVKAMLYNFLQSLLLRPEERRGMREVQQLLELASGPVQGDCYLGVIALGFFSLHFMGKDERRHFIQTTIFGGVTFQRAVPLSYWDIYESGWPIFGLLAAASGVVQYDFEPASAENGFATFGRVSGWLGATGLTGIDLGPRACCNFPEGAPSEDDRIFLRSLTNLTGYSWVDPSFPVLSPRVPLEYLAQSSHRRCSWGRATAYFALAEAALATPGGPSPRVLNSTQSLVALGAHNLDGCEPNTTVLHLMQSVWPFWQVLGRLEQRNFPAQQWSTHSSGGDDATPSSLPENVLLKWHHLLGSRLANGGPAAGSAAIETLPTMAGRELGRAELASQGAARVAVSGAAAEQKGAVASPVAGPHSCSGASGSSPGLVHVAFSTDLAQIDGLIVALQSATLNAKGNATRLCFHTFVLPHRRSFVVEALECAFGDKVSRVAGPGEGEFPGNDAACVQALLLHNAAYLTLHDLDADYVRRQVGLPVGSNDPAEQRVMIGEVDLANALRSDVGNLGAVHNFVRFVLHELLPDLARVVYLDVDIVVRGDVCELFDTPLLTENGEMGTIAAVLRANQPLRTYVDVFQPAMPAWLPSEAPSFNAGVMVIDLARWRARGALRLVAEWISQNYRSRLWLGSSQPPLLLLFHDEVVPLEWTWNIDGLGHRLNYPQSVLRYANLLHWTGPLKPWRNHGVNRFLWEPYTLEYCPRYSFREHTTTCRPDSWFC